MAGVGELADWHQSASIMTLIKVHDCPWYNNYVNISLPSEAFQQDLYRNDCI